jgi:hypothetical protein
MLEEVLLGAVIATLILLLNVGGVYVYLSEQMADASNKLGVNLSSGSVPVGSSSGAVGYRVRYSQY